MTISLVAIAAATATLVGGLVAVRLRDRLHLVLGFSAGAVIAVAFFDLLPEAIELADGIYEPSTVLAVAAAGFLGYLMLDRLFLLHGHSDHDIHHARGTVGAGALSIHSLLDGLGIGLAFQVSPAVGVVVTTAVLVHDFSDGINTVNMVLKSGGTRAKAMRWLSADAAAPVVGICLAQLIAVNQSELALLLGMFAGFFIYIGASELIPESHHSHPTVLTTATTVIGALVLYGAVKLAGL